jgi:putative hemolysin
VRTSDPTYVLLNIVICLFSKLPYPHMNVKRLCAKRNNEEQFNVVMAEAAEKYGSNDGHVY